MRILLFVILGLFIFGLSYVSAEEPLDLLISPFIAEIGVPVTHDALIIRDIKHSPTWEMASVPIDGLDYVEGNTYRIHAKKSNDFVLFENPKYELIEIQQVFKSHKPYSWKSLCAPGYHTWDGDCVFAFRCSEDAYPGKPCTTNSVEQDYLRPLQQEKVGMLPEDVICLESLQPAVKPDGSSACVNSSSVDQLLQRGFTLAKNNNNSPYD